MTLKEKVFDVVFDNVYELKKENVVPELEKIAEDFTIRFSEWLLKNYDGIKSVKEQLEIYKKEKGL